MNGFERRREQKKESVRQAAAYLFSASDFDKVTMREIADRAHVSHVTIFKYFTSKQDLTLDVIGWFLEQEYKELEIIVKAKRPYLERLRDIMSFKRKVLDMTDLDLVRIAGGSSTLTEKMTHYQARKSELYNNFFQEGKEKGYVRPEASAHALVMLTAGLRALAKLKPEVLAELKYNRTLMEECIEVLLFGVMVKQEMTEIT